MKSFVLTLGVLVLTLPMSAGQSRRPVLIGLDVLKPILSLATPHRPAYRLAEVSIKIPLATRYLSIAGGYGQFCSDTIYRNVVLASQGYYLKVGTEKPPSLGQGLMLGWNGLLTTCHETGTYSFKGPTFGNYAAPVPERRRLAAGVEGVLGHQFLLSKRAALRLSARATIATLLGSKPDDLRADFVPGIGRVVSDPLVYSVGLGLHLFYQTPPRSVAASNDPNN